MCLDDMAFGSASRTHHLLGVKRDDLLKISFHWKLQDEDLCGHAQPQDDDAPLNLNITGVEPSRLARTPAARTPAFRTPASGVRVVSCMLVHRCAYISPGSL